MVLVLHRCVCAPYERWRHGACASVDMFRHRRLHASCTMRCVSCIWYRASSSVGSADTRVFVASHRGYWHGACVCRVAPAGVCTRCHFVVGKTQKAQELIPRGADVDIIAFNSIALRLIKSRTEAHLFFQINQFTSDHPSLDTVEPVVCSLRVQTVRA